VLSTKVRKILSWAGSALSIFAIIFVVGKLKDYGSEIDYPLFATLALPLIVLSVAYGAANLLLTFAWKDLLKHFGVSVESRWAIRIYGVSQLAKYVPGNIFHFVGRQAIGLDAGLPAWPLAKSAIWEIGVLAISGSLFTILVLHYFYVGIPVILAVGLFLLAVLITIWISNRWFSRWIAQAVGRDIVFLALSGAIFLAVLSLIVSSVSIPGSKFTIVCGAYVIAWLAGLVTPGAPAGAGIREFVLYAILHSFVNEADLLTAIVLGRIITVAGDVLFYILALVIGTRVARTV
jgi:uncharacterized membrane protein YbhN (UPF0104 family)